MAAPDLYLSLTRRCNMRCPGCYLTQQEGFGFANHDMPADAAMEVIEHYALRGAAGMVLNAEGEVTLYPHFADVFRHAMRCMGGNLLWLVTNGIELEHHVELLAGHVNEILVSIDGPDAESHTAFRGGNAAMFEKVVANTRRLVEATRGKGARVTVNAVISRGRERLIPPLIALAEDLRADLVKFTAFHPLEGVGLHEPLRGDDEALRDVFEQVTSCFDYQLAILMPTLARSARTPYRCEMLNKIVVGSAGDFSPCCRIAPSPRWGNFFRDPDGFNSPALVAFRDQVAYARSPDELPSQCRMCSHLSPRRLGFDPNLKRWVEVMRS